MFESGIVEIDHGERIGRRHERDLRAGLAAGIANDFERPLGHAVGEPHRVLLAVPPNGEVEPAGERVHHGDADAVQAARHLVGVLVELTSRVELGHDDLGGGDAFALVNLDRNAATVIVDRNGPVRVQDDINHVAIARERLVDGVVHHLIDHVMETRTVVGVADIHARPFAYGIKALQNFDGLGAVIGSGFSLAFGSRCHGLRVYFWKRFRGSFGGQARVPANV